MHAGYGDRMGTNLWAAYVAVVVPSGERQEDTGKRVGQTQATISRWLNGKAAPDEAAAVAAFAKAYNRNVLEAFVAAGFITEAEAGRGLPAESRRALVLRLGGYRISEISHRLHTSQAAVQRALARGLSKLRATDSLEPSLSIGSSHREDP